jgi:hypothetical protein
MDVLRTLAVIFLVAFLLSGVLRILEKLTRGWLEPSTQGDRVTVPAGFEAASRRVQGLEAHRPTGCATR